jgi:sugar transferase (PEP-CTERM system associated)
MVRLLNAYFPTRTLFLGISEACLVALAFVVASFARLGASNATLMLNYEQGGTKIFTVSAVFIVCMYYFDLYDTSIINHRREVPTRLIQVLGVVCLVLALIYYLYPPLELDRGIFVVGLSLVSVSLMLWRALFFTVNSQDRFAERIVILGEGPLAESLAAECSARPELGLRVVGQLKNPANDNEIQYATPRGMPEHNFIDLIKPYNAKRIVVAMNERRGNLPVAALLELKGQGIRIQDGVEMYEATTGKLAIESLRLSWLLFTPGLEASRLFLTYKRASSVIFSAIALILTLPLMILIALAIRLDSPGPVVFKQKRVGLRGCIFTLLKFRTMINSVIQEEDHRPAEKSDSRFTRLGSLLRRSRLDELPQLLNILRGDMHFVGPRPFVPSQEGECVERIPYYRRRWDVKPGATGWAQVNRGYNATLEDNKDKLAYDLFYIKNLSVGLDALILFKTVKILFLGRGGR